MATDQSYKNKNLSYRGKFQWIFDQGKWNVVRVSGEFKLSEFELTKLKWLKSGVKSMGN